MNEIIQIEVPTGNAKEWCKRYWDTYGFDYDISSIIGPLVDVWPLPGTPMKELKRQLQDNGCTINL